MHFSYPPILMFHSVADHFHPLPWKPIICSTGAFDRFVSHLAKAGYRALSFSDYLGCLEGGDRLPQKAVIITFDDGYLDNWVNVFPILKKYGMKATVFVATDFIDPTETVRKNLGDYWDGRVALDELDWYGYLSWNELRSMSEKGVFEIGSHSKTHTWYFGSSEIVDFRHPGDPYIWLDWNRDPSNKPFWIKRNREENWGSPVYDYGPALTTRIFKPGKEIDKVLTAHVETSGGVSFFESKRWKRDLLGLVRELRNEVSSEGTYESEEASRERQKNEVIESGRQLEQGIGKEIACIAWPNDAYSSELTRIAHDVAGYRITCTVEGRENGNGDYHSVNRIFIGEKFKSSLLNNFWFRAKMTASGRGMIAGIVKSTVWCRRRVVSALNTGSDLEEGT